MLDHVLSNEQPFSLWASSRSSDMPAAAVRSALTATGLAEWRPNLPPSYSSTQKSPKSPNLSLLTPIPFLEGATGASLVPHAFPNAQTPNYQTNLDSNIPLILLCLSPNTFRRFSRQSRPGAGLTSPRRHPPNPKLPKQTIRSYPRPSAFIPAETNCSPFLTTLPVHRDTLQPSGPPCERKSIETGRTCHLAAGPQGHPSAKPPIPANGNRKKSAKLSPRRRICGPIPSAEARVATESRPGCLTPQGNGPSCDGPCETRTQDTLGATSPGSGGSNVLPY
jgi:hypothetical protein